MPALMVCSSHWTSGSEWERELRSSCQKEDLDVQESDELSWYPAMMLDTVLTSRLATIIHEPDVYLRHC